MLTVLLMGFLFQKPKEPKSSIPHNLTRHQENNHQAVI